ncbi:unnamed protein product [Moneuplotes crassus]|uniref:Uncharacterized protein n=1 Tax=Euplotes crassus TaxID=5936 RepID=A0AAD1XFR0_EUPCR|nr:unnamed protein product [Moneuplotes crassus]
MFHKFTSLSTVRIIPFSLFRRRCFVLSAQLIRSLSSDLKYSSSPVVLGLFMFLCTADHTCLLNSMACSKACFSIGVNFLLIFIPIFRGLIRKGL